MRPDAPRPRSWWFRTTVAAGGRLGAGLLRVLGATWRVRLAGHPDPVTGGVPAVGALWHGTLFPAAWRYRDAGIAIPVSRSRDGDRIVAVLDRLGFAPSPRGSSSGGGPAALSGAIRIARNGGTIAVLCDGPRGPAGRCKPGVIAMARAAGLPIYPVAIAARPTITFRSWDRTLLPLPFARVHFETGAPLRVPADASREDLERLREALEDTLERLHRRAQAALER
ncbi:MAG: DUF374 domain-containing protein [Myxococcota bacterium]|nr:DUF374 domain-containing protein [Myxococcota bacterium]